MVSAWEQGSGMNVSTVITVATVSPSVATGALPLLLLRLLVACDFGKGLGAEAKHLGNM